jgi:alkyl sulfatase BDS1-like metallo-beta-lactamase superfamily hydrolase
LFPTLVLELDSDELEDAEISVEGDSTVLNRLSGPLDPDDPNFNIVMP